MNYLILLKDEDDFCRWTSREIQGIAIRTSSGIKCLDSPELDQKKLEKKWIIVACLYGELDGGYNPTGKASNQQQKLKAALSSLDNYRVFHHAGNLNYGKDGYSKVIEGFAKAGFVDAGFSTDNLMNCSEDGSWPWQKKIKPVKTAFWNTLGNDDKNGEDKLSVDDAIRHLNEAWDMASVYFKIEKSVEAVRQGLFPLYVDVNSFSPEAQPKDWQAALKGARVELEQALDAADLPKEPNQIMESWRSLQQGLAQEEKAFIDAAITLLETSIKVLQGTLASPSKQGQELFVARFKELSKACDDRDERLKLFEWQLERTSE